MSDSLQHIDRFVNTKRTLVVQYDADPLFKKGLRVS